MARLDPEAKLLKLEAYAQQGQWQNVLEFASHYKAAAATAQNSPLGADKQQRQQLPATEHCLQQALQQQLDAELSFTTYKVLALMRLRRYSQAGDELAQLGDLPTRQLAGAAGASCVPFGLLYLRAQLPGLLGSPHITVDLLYELRTYCQQQLQHARQLQLQQQHVGQQQPIREAQQAGSKSLQHQPQLDIVQQDQQQQQQQVAHSTSDSSAAAAAAAASAAVALWQHRLRGVTCSLVSHHWQAGAVGAAFQLLDLQLQLQPDDVQLWSLAGRLQLQLNRLPQAARTFTKVQQLVQQQQQQQHEQHGRGEVRDATELQQLVHHNWGCYHAVGGNLTAALGEFKAAQQLLAAANTAAASAATAAGGVSHDNLGPLGAHAAPALLPDASGVGSRQQQQLQQQQLVDGVALCNSAVCMMLMGQLTEAISTLEAGLQQQPSALLQQECALFNLGLMYDLAYPAASGKQARHHMASSVLRIIPDDFDLSCIEPHS